mgnify:CR=1 FL=1
MRKEVEKRDRKTVQKREGKKGPKNGQILEGQKPSKMERESGQKIWGKFASLESGVNCVEFVESVLGMGKKGRKKRAMEPGRNWGPKKAVLGDAF